MPLGFDYEDTYLLNTIPGNSLEDVPTSGNEVIIACKTKKTRIAGYISEGIDIKGKAKWKEMFGGGLGSMTKGILAAGSNLLQLTNGTTLQQPWMSRKYYESTEPFTFTFGINFVSHGDAMREVFLPAQYLLSLIYPRATGTNALSEMTKGTISEDSLIGLGIHMMDGMVIPGPSLTYGTNADSDKQGDAVTVTIGQMFAFGGVYLQDVTVKYSSSFDTQGYPLYAKCNVTATCMDANYCDSDGSFLISQFKNEQVASISAFLNKLKKTVGDAVKGSQKIVDTWKGFFGLGGE